MQPKLIETRMIRLETAELVRWSAWPALICYSVTTGLRIGPRANDWVSVERRIAIVGVFLLLLHVLIAMGLAHDWSLSAAYSHTARQTQAAVGWNWGGGVYLNFATLVIWGWTVLAPRDNRSNVRWRSVKYQEVLAQWYLAFMMFNATVVFGSRPAQVAGVLICLGLLCCFLTPERPR
jgi:hypothetical protein